MSRKRLTFKQERFVREYVKDGNATRAVREAYPNIKTKGARCVMASKLVRNDNVQKRIQEILDEAGLTPELITKELKSLIVGEDKSEKNKAIRTAAEIMGLIGKDKLIATQVNIGQQKPIFAEIMTDLEGLDKRIKEEKRQKIRTLADKYNITNKSLLEEIENI